MRPMGKVFRTLDSRPIFWTDNTGSTRRCEGADIHRGVRMLWALCNQDVPADALFHPGDGNAVTCRKCLGAEAVPAPSTREG
jgi:hypothetical protein